MKAMSDAVGPGDLVLCVNAGVVRHAEGMAVPPTAFFGGDQLVFDVDVDADDGEVRYYLPTPGDSTLPTIGAQTSPGV